MNYQEKAKQMVAGYMNECREVWDKNVTIDDLYIVWFCKTLQNWKAVVSGVNIEEYIEVTYNGDTQEVYVDVYKKACNKCLKDGYGVLND